MEILVDTCIWLGLSNGEISGAAIFNKIKDADAYCSVITLGELEFGIASCDDAQEREKRQKFFDDLLAFPLLTIAPSTAKIFGRFATVVKRRQTQPQENPRRRYHDLWIAAQAVESGFALLTDNQSDFKDLPGLQLLTL
ncbi:MAG: PIN domain-containing protein [Planctomycetota bacterium]|jgi:predicted nucleic acid-binding protein|nr:PIN domain-containing protein [Planctomycetota bacterium]